MSEQRTEGWTEREVTTAGGTFVLREAGSGPDLMLFHDEISTGRGAFGDRLAQRFRVVAPVHPGFGAAPRPSWVQSVRDVADAYLDLVEAAELRHAAFVGVSMGAWMAAELALRMPDDVPALAMVTPIGIHVQDQPAADYWYVRDRDRVLFEDLDAMPELELDDQVANEESAARYGWSPRLHDRTLAPRLHRLRMPTQIVWSSDDRLLPRAHLDRWTELLPQADVIEIAGCGHFPNYERPAETAEAVTAFLAPTATGVAR